MSTTVCKFRCLSKTETGDGFSIAMYPVTGGSKENEQFFKRTPAGKFEVSVVNQETAQQFKVGSYYKFTIEETAQ